METNKAIELIFIAWQANLSTKTSKERSRKYVRSNMEELFKQWDDVGCSFDELYDTWLPKAIQAHLPPQSLSSATYRKLKSTVSGFSKTEKEFIEEWNKNIKDEVTNIFFEYFPIPVLSSNKEEYTGSIPQQEYRTLRKYADQFKVLKTDELIKQWKGQENATPADLDKLLENVLGDEK